MVEGADVAQGPRAESAPHAAAAAAAARAARDVSCARSVNALVAAREVGAAAHREELAGLADRCERQLAEREAEHRAHIAGLRRAAGASAAPESAAPPACSAVGLRRLVAWWRRRLGELSAGEGPCQGGSDATPGELAAQQRSQPTEEAPAEPAAPPLGDERWGRCDELRQANDALRADVATRSEVLRAIGERRQELDLTVHEAVERRDAAASAAAADVQQLAERAAALAAAAPARDAADAELRALGQQLSTADRRVALLLTRLQLCDDQVSDARARQQRLAVLADRPQRVEPCDAAAVEQDIAALAAARERLQQEAAAAREERETAARHSLQEAAQALAARRAQAAAAAPGRCPAVEELAAAVEEAEAAARQLAGEVRACASQRVAGAEHTPADAAAPELLEELRTELAAAEEERNYQYCERDRMWEHVWTLTAELDAAQTELDRLATAAQHAALGRPPPPAPAESVRATTMSGGGAAAAPVASPSPRGLRATAFHCLRGFAPGAGSVLLGGGRGSVHPVSGPPRGLAPQGRASSPSLLTRRSPSASPAAAHQARRR
eukprot:TRINITY_DN9587_c2_g1_i1.p1 TRINITY_DN9587_c2_g1~~TRINITY_DN9587_c2_g1_i1.p1  ORF type:complete len:588 (+),score=157.07 TRINITY_DN9587_c2_g1_i1:91-1764(+)